MVKIALVLTSLMEVVDGLQYSSLTINVQLGSSQDIHWATQEHLLIAGILRISAIMLVGCVCHFVCLSVCLFVFVYPAAATPFQRS